MIENTLKMRQLVKVMCKNVASLNDLALDSLISDVKNIFLIERTMYLQLRYFLKDFLIVNHFVILEGFISNVASDA